jgi:hypothetical protein
VIGPDDGSASKSGGNLVIAVTTAKASATRSEIHPEIRHMRRLLKMILNFAFNKHRHYALSSGPFAPT